VKVWIFAFLNVSRILIFPSFCFPPLFASFNITYLLYETNNISDIFLCFGYFVSFAHIWQGLEGVFLYTTKPTGWPKYVNIQAFLRKIKVYDQRNKMTVFFLTQHKGFFEFCCAFPNSLTLDERKSSPANMSGLTNHTIYELEALVVLCSVADL
jgi:hypothetical protein